MLIVQTIVQGRHDGGNTRCHAGEGSDTDRVHDLVVEHELQSDFYLHDLRGFEERDLSGGDELVFESFVGLHLERREVRDAG
jgi:hypothetical protein